MAVRFMTPLLLATTAAAVLSQRYTDAVAIAAICSLGPISEQVIHFSVAHFSGFKSSGTSTIHMGPICRGPYASQSSLECSLTLKGP